MWATSLSYFQKIFYNIPIVYFFIFSMKFFVGILAIVVGLFLIVKTAFLRFSRLPQFDVRQSLNTVSYSTPGSLRAYLSIFAF